MATATGREVKTGLPLVIVEWDDAWTSESPTTVSELVHEPERVTTIGWMLRNDAIGVSLANEFYDSTYRGRTFIPRAMVVKVVPYTLSKPRAPKRNTEGETKHGES